VEEDYRHARELVVLEYNDEKPASWPEVTFEQTFVSSLTPEGREFESPEDWACVIGVMGNVTKYYDVSYHESNKTTYILHLENMTGE
jgi:hypothetical protein